MTELSSIIETTQDWSTRGIQFALATVVGVRGSTYRGLAARQAMSESGASIGTISGGCLDKDLQSVASEVIESGISQLVEFDLTSDDEAIWGWGIGCNGATEVLVEPGGAVMGLVDHLATLGTNNRSAIIHSLSPDSLGARRYLGAVENASVVGRLTEVAQQSLADGRHRVVDVEGERSLIEVVGAASRLIVCGAGHDADPVARFGRELGFDTVVTDDRRNLLTVERFPFGTELVHSEATELANVVVLDHRSFVVLMSHNYLRDLDYLRQLAGTNVPYVGVLGPAERLRRLVDDLRASETLVTDGFLDRLHGPAGLDLGSEGPVEIAWSILAEIMAVRSGRSGLPLSHERGTLLPD